MVAPSYSFTLKGTDDDDPIPSFTVRAFSGGAAKKNRRDFECRIGALEEVLGRHEGGAGFLGAEQLMVKSISVVCGFW